MLLRFLMAVFVRNRRAPRLQVDDVSRIDYRVLPSDIDLLGHMNNGRYLSFMDLGRVDLTNRTGIAERLTRAGIHAVVGQQTIAYRRSLACFERFTLESRLVGVDERSIFIEQRFVSRGQIVARGVVRGRFIARGSGSVKIDAVSRACGYDFSQHPLPDDIAAWRDFSSLPPSKADVPSVW